MVLGIAILLALGCFGARATETKKDLGNGMIEKKIDYVFVDGYNETFIGKEDKYGVRQGVWTIECKKKDGTVTRKEEVTYVDGIRTGSKITEDGRVTYECYKNGRVYPCTKSNWNHAEYVTAHQVLIQHYPWFAERLNMFSFEEGYVEAYLDTLETILNQLGDDPLEFDNYYSDALDSLSYTPYDSLIQRNSTVAFMQGKEEVKKDEFRMAVIDRNWSEGNTTYEIVKNRYPGYLESFIELGIPDEDFNAFCRITDSLMDRDDALYGSPGLESVFFVDTMDQRLYRAINYIMEYEDTSADLKSMRIKSLLHENFDLTHIRKELYLQLNQTDIDSTTQVVAGGVLYFMLIKLNLGDILYLSVREAWFNNRAVVTLPNVFTQFVSSNSETSVTLQGEVVENGGADVTARGIVWADFYNPTTSDNLENLGTGLGTFEITLQNLTPGNTYYARSFATNSAGTAYGNCLTFTAGEAVGIEEPDRNIQDFAIHPNPASAMTTIRFQSRSSDEIALSLINLKGQVVYQQELGVLPPGEHRITVDVSSLGNGIYSCHLNRNGRITATQKMLVVH
jgi:hypothetical protein